MQTSRFQLGVFCALSLTLGVTLVSGDAVGYPAGAAISSAVNPVVSIGGTAYSSEAAKPLLTAPADQALVVTDIVLSSTSGIECKRNHKSELSTSSGAIVGQFETTTGIVATWGSSWGMTSDGRHISHTFESGLRIDPGETLFLGVTQTGQYTRSHCETETSHGVRYSISGYTAAP
jgi:hypothetical protein